VARGVREVRSARPELGVVLITHYQRILDELQPDRVHLLIDGRIVESGGADLARRLESEGYDAWRQSPDTTTGDDAGQIPTGSRQ
jgi:Fe-S cluster assembly ATP-binding protein